MGRRADKAGGEPLGLDPLTLITIALGIWAKVMEAFVACKVQPPKPGPVPTPLADQGVTEESWTQANGAKFAADQCKSGSGFHPRAINRTAKEIARNQNINKKAAKPLAIAALETARDESLEDLAVSIHDAKTHAAAFGVSIN